MPNVLQEHVTSFQTKDGIPVQLRPVRKTDAEQIIEAVKSIISTGEYLQKEKEKTVEEEQKFIDKVNVEGHMYTAVEMNGRVVGIGRVLRGDVEMKRQTGKFRTWITEQAQGKGIGKKMMEHTIAWAEKEQMHKIWLTVFANNTPAIKLYERYGFKQEGLLKQQACIKGKYVDEMVMSYFVP